MRIFVDDESEATIPMCYALGRFKMSIISTRHLSETHTQPHYIIYMQNKMSRKVSNISFLSLIDLYYFLSYSSLWNSKQLYDVRICLLGVVCYPSHFGCCLETYHFCWKQGQHPFSYMSIDFHIVIRLLYHSYNWRIDNISWGRVRKMGTLSACRSEWNLLFWSSSFFYYYLYVRLITTNSIEPPFP